MDSSPLIRKYEFIESIVGIDVSLRRGCSFAVLDGDGNLLDSGWAGNDSVSQTVSDLIDIIEKLASGKTETVAMGIDASRRPLKNTRSWFWEGKTRTWRRKRLSDRGAGRHCEVIIKAHNIAKPQWTSQFSDAPEWMKLGFKIFKALEKYPNVYEVFPSASYRVLEKIRDLSVRLDFSMFTPAPKDMLDACVAAATVREFIQGRGEAVGDGDGLGSIILPRPIREGRIEEVFRWPKRLNVK